MKTNTSQAAVFGRGNVKRRRADDHLDQFIALPNNLPARREPVTDDDRLVRTSPQVGQHHRLQTHGTVLTQIFRSCTYARRSVRPGFRLMTSRPSYQRQVYRTIARLARPSRPPFFFTGGDPSDFQRMRNRRGRVRGFNVNAASVLILSVAGPLARAIVLRDRFDFDSIGLGSLGDRRGRPPREGESEVRQAVARRKEARS